MSEIVDEKEISRGAYGKIIQSTFEDRCIKKIDIFETYKGVITFNSSCLRELNFYKNIVHPTIPKFYNFEIQSPNILCITLERSNINLSDWIKTIGYQERLANFSNIFGHLFRFLIWIHENNIIHGDIKPHNIVLKDGIPQFIDFGSSTISCGNRALTTYWFVSPEDALNNDFGITNDVWAMGIVMYNYIVGRYPFGIPEIKTFNDVVKYFTTLKTLKNIDIPKDIPNYIQCLISNCLTIDKTKRWTAKKALEFMTIESLPPLSPSIKNLNNPLIYNTEDEKIIANWITKHLTNPQFEEKIPAEILKIPNYKTLFETIITSTYFEKTLNI